MVVVVVLVEVVGVAVVVGGFHSENHVTLTFCQVMLGYVEVGLGCNNSCSHTEHQTLLQCWCSEFSEKHLNPYNYFYFQICRFIPQQQ